VQEVIQGWQERLLSLVSVVVFFAFLFDASNWRFTQNYQHSFIDIQTLHRGNSIRHTPFEISTTVLTTRAKCATRQRQTADGVALAQKMHQHATTPCKCSVLQSHSSSLSFWHTNLRRPLAVATAAVPAQQQQGDAPPSPSPPPPSSPPLPSTSTPKPQRPSRLRVRAGNVDDTSRPLLTFEEVQAAAAAKGLALTLKTLGPFYRIVCREAAGAGGGGGGASGGSNSSSSNSSSSSSSSNEGSSKGSEGKLLGVTAGFLAPPFKLAHCDTLQVFTRGLRGAEGARVRGGAGLNVALLLGGAVFAHAAAAGCTKAEILAINDDGRQRACVHGRALRVFSLPLILSLT
jgi:uncharacterized membrane protein YgcG